MKPREFILQKINGENIIAYEWKSEKKPKGVIAVVHGLGEHSGRYQYVADFYNQRDFSVISFDLFGHGKSGGKRGELREKDDHLKSIDKLIEYATDNYFSAPIFLRGHSVGGELVLWYTLERKPELKGVIATSPYFATFEPLPPIKVALARVMNSILPSFSMENGLDPNILSRDISVVDKYIHDPLVHKLVSARLGWMMVERGNWIMQHAIEFPLPLLLVVGSNEKLVDRNKIEEFSRQVPEVNLKIWENLYHETHNEPEKKMVLEYEFGWINKHLK
jgi:acylglycerol lipase